MALPSVLLLFNGRQSDLFNEAGHGHFDVKLHHVSHGVELAVKEFVGKREESDNDGLRRKTLVRFCKWEGGEELPSMRIDTIIKHAL